ncbi:MAG: serine/threonine protein kinase, partial [Xenococcus sp. (in: cyanobacteria)]
MKNYQIIQKIYESANSEVYRGIRNSDGQSFILKVLKQDYPTPQELTRYKQEYEITRNLNLDGAIKAYGLEPYQKTLVIIFEDFGASSLKELMNSCHLPTQVGGVGEQILEFLRLAIKITETLGQIHAANIIHKDINPSNIVLNPETKEVKIIDFGLSTILTRENPTLKHPNVLEGTLAYISPE